MCEAAGFALRRFPLSVLPFPGVRSLYRGHVTALKVGLVCLPCSVGGVSVGSAFGVVPRRFFSMRDSPFSAGMPGVSRLF